MTYTKIKIHEPNLEVRKKSFLADKKIPKEDRKQQASKIYRKFKSVFLLFQEAI